MGVAEESRAVAPDPGLGSPGKRPGWPEPTRSPPVQAPRLWTPGELLYAFAPKPRGRWRSCRRPRGKVGAEPVCARPGQGPGREDRCFDLSVSGLGEPVSTAVGLGPLHSDSALRPWGDGGPGW